MGAPSPMRPVVSQKGDLRLECSNLCFMALEYAEFLFLGTQSSEVTIAIISTPMKAKAAIDKRIKSAGVPVSVTSRSRVIAASG